MTSRRLLPRLALGLAATAVALLLAEAAFVAFGPRELEKPYLVIPGDETRVPLSEIALFRPFDDPARRVGPSARFRPYLFLKGWYDSPTWDYFDESDCVDYVFNRWGLRDDDFALEKAPGEYRVVALGDSFTFGIGAQQPDVWTEVLQRGLAARRDGPVEVINAGFTSGHRPEMYEPWILDDAVALDPDLVLVGLCMNDMHPGIEMYAYEVRRPEPVLGGRSALLDWLGKRWARREAPAVVDFDQRIRHRPETWERQQAAMVRARDALAARGIDFAVVLMPMLSGLREEPYPYAGIVERVHAFGAEHGIRVIDTVPAFLGERDEDFWAHPTDQHPNHLGQRRIGETVLAALTGG